AEILAASVNEQLDRLRWRADEADPSSIQFRDARRGGCPTQDDVGSGILRLLVEDGEVGQISEHLVLVLNVPVGYADAHTIDRAEIHADRPGRGSFGLEVEIGAGEGHSL